MSFAEDGIEEVLKRAWGDLQLNESVNGIDFINNDDLKDAFDLGVFHGVVALLDVMAEIGAIEQHTGPEFDYLYEDE